MNANGDFAGRVDELREQLTARFTTDRSELDALTTRMELLGGAGLSIEELGYPDDAPDVSAFVAYMQAHGFPNKDGAHGYRVGIVTSAPLGLGRHPALSKDRSVKIGRTFFESGGRSEESWTELLDRTRYAPLYLGSDRLLRMVRFGTRVDPELPPLVEVTFGGCVTTAESYYDSHDGCRKAAEDNVYFRVMSLGALLPLLAIEKTPAQL